MSTPYEDVQRPLRAGDASSPHAEEPGLPRRHRRRNSSSSPGRTLYALAESTSLAWQRVKDLYSMDPVARSANMQDVRSGYERIDPLGSKAVLWSLTALLGSFLAYQMYFYWRSIMDLILHLQLHTMEFVMAIAILGVAQLAYRVRRPNAVYLVDFQTYKPPKHYQLTHEKFMELSRNTGKFSDESLAFQRKLLEKSGLGQATHVPDVYWRSHEIAKANGEEGALLTMHNARLEAEMVLFGVMDALFLANGLDPQDIDILIVNCSLFNPTPSLSAMIVNKYKLKSSILTYNLAGMGCSAGLISIDLAKDLLQVHRNVRAVVVSTENITQNWYTGTEKSMLISNTLFRLGGAAILLSNRSSDRKIARHQLVTTVRTHSGNDDLAYDSVFQMEDKKGVRGVKLSKNIMDIAGSALKKNITSLAPLVFPFDEHIKFGIYLFKKRVLKYKKMPPFVPDFHRAFSHFCIHTGGRAVLDVFEKALSLTERDIAPSRNTLYRYGNVSSASIWYEFEYVENSGYLRRGQRTWQIAFGSGFKCNSAVWVSLVNQPECRLPENSNGSSSSTADEATSVPVSAP
eukprot:CAMPEP_0198309954 /NCGR_PEP_ID=MMETSP1450-20131203/2173_1 /TAXON_ID=753684 ORGANISM="Madagascaria erythrocladiodes, Strain CCMP3234" /NCGR_SAMPLE_ID=MMETSP1450 /ASSEMBLY_ACC=CAM_ASM_001115 /LENGTH=572 /DNA_ID=CAMNT_0044012739 /DNA_START=167 /DNA_END=1885 /DNA_ORIENTATION=-